MGPLLRLGIGIFIKAAAAGEAHGVFGFQLLHDRRNVRIVAERGKDSAHPGSVEGGAGQVHPPKRPGDARPAPDTMPPAAVDRLRVGVAVAQHVQRLAIHRVAEAIDEKAFDVAIEQRGLFVYFAGEVHDGVDGRIGGLIATNHFDKPRHIRRRHPVHPREALRMLERFLHQRNRDRRGVAGERYVGADDLLELLEDLLLDCKIFRNRFDHEIAIGEFVD